MIFLKNLLVEMDRCKEQLDLLQTEPLNESGELQEEVLRLVSPLGQSSVREGLKRIANPREALKRMVYIFHILS